MKKNMSKLAIASIAALSIFSVSVIANDTVKINADTTTVEDDQAAEETQYGLESGTISSIEKAEDGTYRITIENDNMGMVANFANAVMVFDQKDGSVKTMEDLEEGMEITFLVKANSPMTMSIPPMTSSVDAIVINAEDGLFMDHSIFNDELINSDNSLQLNISEETSILDLQGSKIRYSQDDVKGQECLVFYGATTRSIPAQTNPVTVVILSNEEEMPQTETDSEVAEATEDVLTEETTPLEERSVDEVAPTEEDVAAIELVGLRDLAEGLGYEVTWTANDQPVILEKEDQKN